MLKEIPLNTDDVKQAFKIACDDIENIQSIMIITSTKDGVTRMVTSKMSGNEKAYLVQFANAFMNRHFNMCDEI